MLNIRIVILSVVLVLMLLVAAQLAATGTEIASDPLGYAIKVLNNQEQSDTRNEARLPPYRARLKLDECFDVPFSEATECWNASQTTAPK